MKMVSKKNGNPCAVCGEQVSSREEAATWAPQYPNMTSTINCRWRPCPQQAIVHYRCREDGGVWDCGRHPWSSAEAKAAAAR